MAHRDELDQFTAGLVGVAPGFGAMPLDEAA
jgi:hypothetical protein